MTDGRGAQHALEAPALLGLDDIPPSLDPPTPTRVVAVVHWLRAHADEPGAPRVARRLRAAWRAVAEQVSPAGAARIGLAVAEVVGAAGETRIHDTLLADCAARASSLPSDPELTRALVAAGVRAERLPADPAPGAPGSLERAREDLLAYVDEVPRRTKA